MLDGAAWWECSAQCSHTSSFSYSSIRKERGARPIELSLTQLPIRKSLDYVTAIRLFLLAYPKDKNYLCYTVFWVSNGKSRNKTFQVGNVEKVTADDELHAFRTAKLFRICYEVSIDNDIEFHDEKFVGWKKIRLYDDENLNAV